MWACYRNPLSRTGRPGLLSAARATPAPQGSGASATDNNWHPGEAATHEDPLLDALVVLTQLHGNPFTAAALSAGSGAAPAAVPADPGA